MLTWFVVIHFGSLGARLAFSLCEKKSNHSGKATSLQIHQPTGTRVNELQMWKRASLHWRTWLNWLPTACILVIFPCNNKVADLLLNRCCEATTSLSVEEFLFQIYLFSVLLPFYCCLSAPKLLQDSRWLGVIADLPPVFEAPISSSLGIVIKPVIHKTVISNCCFP